MNKISNRFNKKTFKIAIRACAPVILGYLPTGFAFGLMLTSAGYSFILAGLMSIAIYTGAGQYLAVQFLVKDVSLVQTAVMTFLVNSKHMFYGLSLLDDYKKSGFTKPYFIFSLTDETYALLTKPLDEKNIDRSKYCFYVSVIDQASWVTATFLGAIFGTVVKFNVTGMEFAMTALFIVILLDQLKTYKTKIPFIAGTAAALFSLLAFGKENMLLIGAALAVALMLVFRDYIERKESI